MGGMDEGGRSTDVEWCGLKTDAGAFRRNDGNTSQKALPHTKRKPCLPTRRCGNNSASRRRYLTEKSHKVLGAQCRWSLFLSGRERAGESTRRCKQWARSQKMPNRLEPGLWLGVGGRRENEPKLGFQSTGYEHS
jgi:hypothetical protein